jgi:hypothetical protein
MRKYIDARDFKEQGFLQEANRQFFHPHGLALEITRVTDESVASCSFVPSELDELGSIVSAERSRLEAAGGSTEAVDAVLARIHGADVYEVDEAYFSGVWDYRNDPEGIIFADLAQPDAREKAKRVEAERLRHFDARCALFGVPADIARAVQDADVQPLDWKPPEDTDGQG